MKWLNASDRNAVTLAQARIDQLLTTDPEQHGVDFYGDRLLVEPPLQVVYRINIADMQVVIEAVW